MKTAQLASLFACLVLAVQAGPPGSGIPPPPPPANIGRSLIPRDLEDTALFNALKRRYLAAALEAREAAPPAPKGGAALKGASPKSGGGKINEKGQLTVDAIVGALNKKQMLPPALESAFDATPLAQQYNPPSGRSPVDPEIASHDCSYSIGVMKSGNIPDSIKKALDDPKNGWTKKAGGAGGAQNAAKAGGANKAVKSGKGKRSVEDVVTEILARDAYAYAEAEAEAYAYAEPEAFAEAEPEPFAEADEYYDFDLFSRDAEPEVEMDYFDWE